VLLDCYTTNVRRYIPPTVFASAAISLLNGCGEPKYSAWEVSLDETPGVKYLFSAADATRSSPVFMGIQGREPTTADAAFQMRLIRRWVAAHAPEDSTFAYWASDECGLKRKGEFPGCHIFAINLPGTNKAVEFYFYGGNWPFPNK
jgi:hypothetical protein